MHKLINLQCAICNHKPIHGDVSVFLSNLAFATDNTGEAVSLHQKALAIRRAALGEHHPDYAQSLNNLASSYHDQGDYASAEPLYRQAAEVFRASLGESHPR